jgi:hypothetical protein
MSLARSVTGWASSVVVSSSVTPVRERRGVERGRGVEPSLAHASVHVLALRQVTSHAVGSVHTTSPIRTVLSALMRTVHWLEVVACGTGA